MELSNILEKGSIIACAKVASKRQLLQELAKLAANDIGVPEQKVFDSLMAREQLGSTGLGNGIAIPHGKLDGITSVRAVFARLENAIDFDAVDEQPIDLAIMLLAPTGSGADHLKALAKVARLLRSEKIITLLRETRDIDKLHDILISQPEDVNVA